MHHLIRALATPRPFMPRLAENIKLVALPAAFPQHQPLRFDLLPEIAQLDGDLGGGIADRGDQIAIHTQEGQERDGEGDEADDLGCPDQGFRRGTHVGW